MFDNEGFKSSQRKIFVEYSLVASSNRLDFTIPTYPEKQAVGLSGRKSMLFLFEIAPHVLINSGTNLNCCHLMAKIALTL
jgi:hypothetical protein